MLSTVESSTQIRSRLGEWMISSKAGVVVRAMSVDGERSVAGADVCAQCRVDPAAENHGG